MPEYIIKKAVSRSGEAVKIHSVNEGKAYMRAGYARRLARQATYYPGREVEAVVIDITQGNDLADVIYACRRTKLGAVDDRAFLATEYPANLWYENIKQGIGFRAFCAGI